jgi:hypothetical protein
MGHNRLTLLDSFTNTRCIVARYQVAPMSRFAPPQNEEDAEQDDDAFDWSAICMQCQSACYCPVSEEPDDDEQG